MPSPVLCLSMHKIWPLASPPISQPALMELFQHIAVAHFGAAKSTPCSFKATSIAILVITVPTAADFHAFVRVLWQSHKSSCRRPTLCHCGQPSSNGRRRHPRQCRNRLHFATQRLAKLSDGSHRIFIDVVAVRPRTDTDRAHHSMKYLGATA